MVGKLLVIRQKKITAVFLKMKIKSLSADYFHFEITKPISPYVFAFAAGEFEEFRWKKCK